jgi:hypothetical protein
MATFRVVNVGTSPSPAGAPVATESLDSAAEVMTPSPVALPALSPGGSVEVEFQFRTSFNGIPVACAGAVPFRVSLTSGTGIEVAYRVPTPARPDGCGNGARSLALLLRFDGASAALTAGARPPAASGRTDAVHLLVPEAAAPRNESDDRRGVEQTTEPTVRAARWSSASTTYARTAGGGS